jgi:hypothetical protein
MTESPTRKVHGSGPLYPDLFDVELISLDPSHEAAGGKGVGEPEHVRRNRCNDLAVGIQDVDGSQGLRCPRSAPTSDPFP